MPMSGGQATIVQHCAVFGRLETPVRKFEIRDVAPHAQHAVSVCVVFTKPGKRSSMFITVIPDNIRYLTVEVGGETVYDSRIEVPCDMAKWAESAARHRGQPSMTPHTDLNPTGPNCAPQRPIRAFPVRR
jgi:hypothetical protein